jgi:hypothetical protein
MPLRDPERVIALPALHERPCLWYDLGGLVVIARP